MKNFPVIQLFGLFILLSSFSCNKTEDANQPATTIEITVRDGNSWSLSNKAMNPVSGASVKIYAEQTDIINYNPPSYTATTDQEGKASIPVEFKRQYFFTVQKDDASNVINGLLIIGIFQTEDEIQSASGQTPAATIGSPRLLDTNQDGIVRSPADNIYGDYIDVIQNETVKKTSIIYQ